MKAYRYPWPASAISSEEMALLHSVRESSAPRVPISRLIAKAIHAVYGNEESSKVLKCESAKVGAEETSKV